jgi:hypothetical protein
MAVPDAYMPLAIQRWAFDIGRANYILSTSAHDKRMLDLYIEKISRVLDDVTHVAEHLPADQVEAASRELVMLLALLREASSVAVDSTIDGQLQVLRHQLPLHGGRPKLDIDLAWLSTAVNQLRLPLTTIADTLGCSARTVRRVLLESGICSAGSASRLSSALSEGDLDTIVAQQLERQPGCGVSYMRGSLQSIGVMVTKKSIRDSLNRLHPFRTLLRRNLVGQRRRYSVAGANLVWHHDGQHGLIAFGIVIHGFIDGFSRLVPALHV